MNKTFLFLFFVLVLVNISYALDCQYTELERYQEEGCVLYYKNSNNNEGDCLEISDFKKGNKASFFAYNPNEFEVMAHFNYSISGKVTDVAKTGKRIKPGTSEEIFYYCHLREGDCYINENSINYYISQKNGEPRLLFPDEGIVTKTREVCKKCGDKVCLNNGSKCSKNEQCGCSFCNIDGKCGTFVDCSNGKLNCKNQSCLTPSTKVGGKGYMCDWECKYGKNEEKEGVCKEGWIPYWLKIISFIGFVALLVIVVWFLPRIIKAYLANKKLEEKKKELEEIEGKIEVNKQYVSDMEQTIDKNNKKLTKLKDLIKNAEGKKKEELERVRKQTEQHSIDLEQKIKKQQSIEDDLKKRAEKVKNEEMEVRIKKALNKYQKIYGEKIEYDKNKRYLVFKSNRRLLHVWVYEKYLEKLGKRLGIDEIVHHIDRDKLNDDLYNLIALDKDVHNIHNGRFNHDHISLGDWESGIKELKDQLGMKDEDFPLHIQKRLASLKDSKNEKQAKIISYDQDKRDVKIKEGQGYDKSVKYKKIQISRPRKKHKVRRKVKRRYQKKRVAKPRRRTKTRKR